MPAVAGGGLAAERSAWGACQPVASSWRPARRKSVLEMMVAEAEAPSAICTISMWRKLKHDSATPSRPAMSKSLGINNRNGERSANYYGAKDLGHDS